MVRRRSYEYDAQAGTLRRVSIGEGGYNDNGLEGQLGAYLFGPSAGDASIVPAHATLNARTVPARSDPTMSDDGQYLFFQSPVALTPGALNDVVDGVREGTNLTLYAQNFYEYHDGHVYLLASVTTETGLKFSTLLGSDTSGSNVFFGTLEPLVPEDGDANVDFYDAHTCRELRRAMRRCWVCGKARPARISARGVDATRASRGRNALRRGELQRRCDDAQKLANAPRAAQSPVGQQPQVGPQSQP